jgi:hypothetical protein
MQRWLDSYAKGAEFPLPVAKQIVGWPAIRKWLMLEFAAVPAIRASQ